MGYILVAFRCRGNHGVFLLTDSSDEIEHKRTKLLHVILFTDKDRYVSRPEKDRKSSKRGEKKDRKRKEAGTERYREDSGMHRRHSIGRWRLCAPCRGEFAQLSREPRLRWAAEGVSPAPTGGGTPGESPLGLRGGQDRLRDGGSGQNPRQRRDRLRRDRGDDQNH